MTELKWFVAGVILLGIIWLASGGLQSATKNDPFIQPSAPLSTGKTYGTNTGNFIANFLFPWSNPALKPTATKPSVSKAALPISPNTQITTYTQYSGKTYYGADKAPTVIKSVDTLRITKVSHSSDAKGGTDGEYVKISAPATNKKAILLTGMLLESRMTGNQQDIRQGVPVYYANNINQQEPIFLKPGEVAYVISGRSPFGYSFKINKCIGYWSNYGRNFVIPLPGGCPGILDYPLPERPNAFSDNCVDFLRRVPVCQFNIRYPTNIESACKTFVAERMSYTRCVADFGHDPDFLTHDWRIYLGRDTALWKTRREIVDLIDQNGYLVSTYTY